MVTLSDVSALSTRMTYLVGPNMKYLLSQLNRDSEQCKCAVEDFRSVHPDNLETTVGLADSAFVLMLATVCIV
jgi:hypothetical protein